MLPRRIPRATLRTSIGRGFGNYPQDVNLRIEYDVADPDPDPARSLRQTGSFYTRVATACGMMGTSISVRYSVEAATSPGPLRYRSRSGPADV